MDHSFEKIFGFFKETLTFKIFWMDYLWKYLGDFNPMFALSFLRTENTRLFSLFKVNVLLEKNYVYKKPVIILSSYNIHIQLLLHLRLRWSWHLRL